MTWDRHDVFPEPELPRGAEITAAGRSQAASWTVGPSAFLDYVACDSEAEYKRRCMENGRIMQHAHLGFRDRRKSIEACRRIHERLERKGGVDRYGICLDWSMGYPRAERTGEFKGTGLILAGPEEFAEVTGSAPVACHFGDFVLGFPAAMENTCAALSAGATVIGNLGQYFTFRLPGNDDDLAATRSTLEALALIAAQPEEVLVHSNLDDGFAAVFSDLACALGAALVEKYIVEELIGGRLTHCFGHHYSSSLHRFAFTRALAEVSDYPGSMIYGNTVSYRGSDAENYASLAGYLLVDILAQRRSPSGHAINPVPVTENRRIPDIEEIVAAQLCARRLVDVEADHGFSFKKRAAGPLIDRIVQGGKSFRRALLRGFDEAGIDTTDAFEMLLAIRRIGGRKLEQWYGPGKWDESRHGRRPLVLSDVVRSLEAGVAETVDRIDQGDRQRLEKAGLTVLLASSDVHEHGKRLLQGALTQCGVRCIDGGESAEPGRLARLAEAEDVDAVCISTYNGVALNYFGQVRDELIETGLDLPILIGGQLNQIEEESVHSLPVNVEDRLVEAGAVVCQRIEDAIPVLLDLAGD